MINKIYKKNLIKNITTMKDKITNEFGENISEKELDEITKKIHEFSVEEIDEFWFKNGWVDSEKGDNKALPDWRLKKIKDDLKFAKISISDLFCESKKEEFIQNFKSIVDEN